MRKSMKCFVKPLVVTKHAESNGKSEHKPNVSSTDGKNSTCSEIHPTYTHGNAGCIRTGQYNASYFCPEFLEVPNPMHGAEFQIHIRTCTFCYHRLTKKLYHKK